MSTVTLTSTKHQEAWAYAQPNFEPREARLDRLLLPDWDPAVVISMLYARPECNTTMRNLPYLQPSVLYVFGGKSPLPPPRAQDEKTNKTGTGIGGSGGLAEGKEEKVVFFESGHYVIFEKVNECPHAATHWTDQWFYQWLTEETFCKGYNGKKSDDGMLKGSKAWVSMTKFTNDTPRPRMEKL